MASDSTTATGGDSSHLVLPRRKLYACLRNIFQRMPDDWQFRCDFCHQRTTVRSYLRHQSLPGHDREACLVCSCSLQQLNFSKVYTHLMCCLSPPGTGMPIDRRNVRVDPDYWQRCVAARQEECGDYVDSSSSDDYEEEEDSPELQIDLTPRAHRYNMSAAALAADQPHRVHPQFRPRPIVARDNVGKLPSDHADSLNCLACDHQRATCNQAFRDTWPDSGGVASFEWPRDSVLESFLSNDEFRRQADRVPDWLRSDDHLAEEPFDFASSGVSREMANLLHHAYSSPDLVLRHYYIYDFDAAASLRRLFSQPNACYVFPFTCLCSSLCFAPQSDLPDLLRVSSFPLFERVVAYVSRLRTDNPTVCLDIGTSQPTSRQQQQQQQQLPPPLSPDTKEKATQKRVPAKTRRAFEQYLAYLQRQLSTEDSCRAYRRRYLHRHLLVCFRDEREAKRFSRTACRQFRPSTLRLGCPAWLARMSHEFPFAFAHVQETGSYYSAGNYHDVTSATQLVETLVSLCGPQKPLHLAAQPFAERLAELDRVYAEFREDRVDVSRLAGLLVTGLSGPQSPRVSARYRLQTCVSNPSNQTVGRLFHRLGRFFLYDERARDATRPMTERYRRYCEFSAQTMGWEEDHFYVAVPMIRHAQHIYTAMIPGAVQAHVNRLCRRSMRQRGQLLAFVDALLTVDREHFYTRLGYVLNMFLASWPVDHRLPLRGRRYDARLDETAALRFDQAATAAVSAGFSLYGDMVDLRIEIEPKTIHHVIERLTSATAVTTATANDPPVSAAAADNTCQTIARLAAVLRRMTLPPPPASPPPQKRRRRT